MSWLLASYEKFKGQGQRWLFRNTLSILQNLTQQAVDEKIRTWYSGVEKCQFLSSIWLSHVYKSFSMADPGMETHSQLMALL